MKKLFLSLALVAGFGLANAQIAKGKIVVDVNTGSYATGNTSFGLTSVDGTTSWRVGAEGGYFIAPNFAVKAGLGFQDSGIDGADSEFLYKVGAQYYVANKFPVGVDLTGSTLEDSPLYIGVEGGYAWFVAPNVAITPKVRYNISTDSDKGESAFQGLIGFSVFFK